MTDYEIHLAGPIGPVALSSLPGFTTTTIPAGTVLTGAVAGPDELLSVINVLTTHGAALIDIWINRDGSR